MIRKAAGVDSFIFDLRTVNTPTAGGNAFIGVRSDLTPKAFINSRISESENFDVVTTPTRVTRHPARSADDLIFQVDCVTLSASNSVNSRFIIKTTLTESSADSAALLLGPDPI